jgi:hypothetical protein
LPPISIDAALQAPPKEEEPNAEQWPWAVAGDGAGSGWKMPIWDGTVRCNGLCLTTGGSANHILGLSRCTAASAADQRFFLAPNGNLQLWSGGQSPCVALDSGSGPALVMYGCNTGPNEVFAFNRTAGTLCSANLVTRERLCLIAQGQVPPSPPTTSTVHRRR